MAIEVKCAFDGHEIVVRIAEFDTPTAKLYIDGKVVDSSEASFGSGSILRGSIERRGGHHIVEVKRPFYFKTPKILVDGQTLVLAR
ncbi:hypothetical protein [Methylocystis sp.]|jgi:hypothetical protein|uniref:hypothetical protein n=1 Tax=Methylocystis sp. TaxID=1911079 RepID=UPI003DA23370